MLTLILALVFLLSYPYTYPFFTPDLIPDPNPNSNPKPYPDPNPNNNPKHNPNSIGLPNPFFFFFFEFRLENGKIAPRFKEFLDYREVTLSALNTHVERVSFITVPSITITTYCMIYYL